MANSVGSGVRCLPEALQDICAASAESSFGVLFGTVNGVTVVEGAVPRSSRDMECLEAGARLPRPSAHSIGFWEVADSLRLTTFGRAYFDRYFARPGRVALAASRAAGEWRGVWFVRQGADLRASPEFRFADVIDAPPRPRAPSAPAMWTLGLLGLALAAGAAMPDRDPLGLAVHNAPGDQLVMRWKPQNSARLEIRDGDRSFATGVGPGETSLTWVRRSEKVEIALMAAGKRSVRLVGQ
ncbi:MAG: hypothetical protein K2X35_17145 [Bryobacteraceae bacterium]|nr:hypothetical protein [Bryobacteraceae bacterium]